MNVSIARMKHVDNSNAVPPANLLNLPNDVRQFGARHHAVLRAIARAQPANGAECLLAAFP